MFNHGLLTAQRGRAAHPEHTCSKMSVGFIVLKHQGRLPAHGRQIERILHDHDNIDIVGFRVAVTQRFSMLGFEYFSAADDQRARETQPPEQSRLLRNLPWRG